MLLQFAVLTVFYPYEIFIIQYLKNENLNSDNSPDFFQYQIIISRLKNAFKKEG